MRLHFVDIDPNVVEELRGRFGCEVNVTCECGDILALAHHTIVSPANSYGFMDGGIDAAYSAFFGPQPQLQIQVQDAVNRRPEGLLPVGASIAIHTGHQRIRFLIVAPTMHIPEEVPARNCYAAMRAILRQTDAHPEIAEDVFCPGLATGTGRVSPADAASEMFRAFQDWQRQRSPEQQIRR